MTGNKTVLVVEDDADVSLGYRILLRANHYDVLAVADGSAAINEARTHRPDLIILDLGLPTGDGFFVLERLRAHAQLSLIPIVVVSARDVRGNQERVLREGARAYVQKPWDDDELLRLIGQLVKPVRAVSTRQ